MTLFEGHIPVHINISHGREVIGWAESSQNENGTTRLTINFDSESSKKLADMVEIWDLYALGFAGKVRTPEVKE